MSDPIIWKIPGTNDEAMRSQSNSCGAAIVPTRFEPALVERSAILTDLVLRLARETRGGDISVGELKGLSVAVSATTVRTWLPAGDLGPVGTRRGVRWRNTLSNGALLNAAEDAAFDGLLTTDRRIRYQ